jgi:5,5'-dehydrodivanillate O-demethylase
VLRGELRIADIEERLNVVNVQDYVAQCGQGAIADRHNERLGRSDAVLILMRKLWLRELQALADGRPLKRWRRAERVTTTAGVAGA